MKPFRVSIAGVMGLVVIAAVGLMGLREGKPLWASLTFGSTLLFLLGSSLNALLRPANSRAGWLGFALFGWVSLALSFGPWAKLELPPMPSTWLVDASLARLHPEPEYEPDATWQAQLIYATSVRSFTPRLKPGAVVWPGDADAFPPDGARPGRPGIRSARRSIGTHGSPRVPNRLDRSPARP